MRVKTRKKLSAFWKQGKHSSVLGKIRGMEREQPAARKKNETKDAASRRVALERYEMGLLSPSTHPSRFWEMEGTCF
jgi:hypothetical protein